MSVIIDSTVRVGELPPSDFNLTDNLPHEVGTDLNRGTVQQLADIIGNYLGTSDSLAFNPTTVVDGGTLPATTSNEWLLAGKGTFHNVGGAPDIVTTEELNAITSNGTYWSLAVQIPINVELAGITQNIRSGYTQTTPSEDALYKALILLSPLFSPFFSGIPTTPTPNADDNSLQIANTAWVINLLAPLFTPASLKYTALTTGVNQVFTGVNFKPRLIFKSNGFIRETSQWTYNSTTKEVTIIVNLNAGNSIDIIP